MPPGQRPRRRQRRQQIRRLNKPPCPALGLGHRALDGAGKPHTPAAQHGHIRLCCRVFPHRRVHRRRHQHRRAAGQQHGGGQIRGQPMRHARQHIGARGGDHDPVRPARQTNMANALLGRPKIMMHRAASECRHRLAGDETRAALSQNGPHLMPGGAGQPDKHQRLEGRNTARDDDQKLHAQRPLPPALEGQRPPTPAITAAIPNGSPQSRPRGCDSPPSPAPPRASSPPAFPGRETSGCFRPNIGSSRYPWRSARPGAAAP